MAKFWFLKSDDKFNACYIPKFKLGVPTPTFIQINSIILKISLNKLIKKLSCIDVLCFYLLVIFYLKYEKLLISYELYM
jgi:hypothetical protein